MTDEIVLSPTQEKTLRTLLYYRDSYGRRLYANQEGFSPKTLTSLVNLGLADAEDANDKRKTYGITEKGESLLAEL